LWGGERTLRESKMLCNEQTTDWTRWQGSQQAIVAMSAFSSFSKLYRTHFGVRFDDAVLHPSLLRPRATVPVSYATTEPASSVHGPSITHRRLPYNSTRGSRPQRSDVAYRQIAGASANPLTPTKTAIHRVRMSPLLSAVGTQQQQQPIVPTTLARCSIPGPCYYRPVGAIGQVCAHARVTSERISEQQEEVTSDQNI